LAKILGKKEVLVEEDDIGLNIEETEGYFPVAEGFKSERHHLILTYRPLTSQKEGLSNFGRDKPADERSELRNYIANRPQNTIWILIKYIVLLIFFLHQFMYINKKLYQFSALKMKKNMFKKVVIPAEAGIQISFYWSWIPVFTGMTGKMNC
jgi:hypothetical protein